MCHAHARPCLSTGWALNRRFGLTSGTAAVLAQGGGGVYVARVLSRVLPQCHTQCHATDVVSLLTTNMWVVEVFAALCLCSGRRGCAGGWSTGSRDQRRRDHKGTQVRTREQSDNFLQLRGGWGGQGCTWGCGGGGGLKFRAVAAAVVGGWRAGAAAVPAVVKRLGGGGGGGAGQKRLAGVTVTPRGGEVTQGSIRMAVHHRRRGGGGQGIPPQPPPK